MTPPRGVVGLAPKDASGTGRAVVGLAPTKGPTGRTVVGLAGRQPPAKKSGGGGGFFHELGQKLDLAGRDIKGIPGGIINQANIGVVQPFKNLVTTGHPYAHGAGEKIDKLTAQTMDSIRTSIDHPGRDPFATLTVVGAPLFHGVGRAGVGTVEAARAAKAGEGVRGVVRASTRKPETIPRSLKSGSAETPLIPSRGGGGRLVQMGYDKVVQGALDKNEAGKATGPVSSRIAAHGQKRVGGALNEEAGIAQRSRAVPASLLDKAAGKLSKLPARRREEQAALELTSTQSTAAEAAAYHRGQAAKGVNPKLNEAVANLYDRVAARDLVHLDESKPAGQKVFINPAHTRLAKTDAALSRVQTEGDRIIVEKNIREPAALQTRINAPGKVRAGATYEKPTPAKQGVESPMLRRERARLVSLERRHSSALAKDAAEHAAQRAGVSRLAATESGIQTVHIPGTEAAATARLEVLDRMHAKALDQLAPQVNPYSHELTASETKSRNTMRGRMAAGKQPATGKAIEGRVGGGSKTIKTVSQEVRDLAEAKLHELIARYPEHPVAKRAAAVIAEREQIQQILNRRGEAAFAGDKLPALPTTATRSITDVPTVTGGRSVHLGSTHRERIVTLGHAIEEQKSRVAQMEKQAAARVKPTGFVGGETARPGRGFVSERVSDKKLSKAEVSGSRGDVVGAAKSPVDSKTYEARALAQGLRPKHVTAGASRHFRQILKFVNTDARRRTVLQTGSDLRRSTRDVLVREPDQAAEKLSAQVEQALGRQHSNVDTAEELATQEGLRAAHQAFIEHMIPGLKERFTSDRSQGVGVKAPEGFKWVDKGALGDLAKAPAGPRGKIAKSVDTVNSAVTAATVYFKVGHVGTRVLTNAATNIVQGSAAPLQMKRSWQLWDKLGEEDRARALADAGQHGFASLPHEGNNLVAVAAGKGAQWWAKHADAMFRFNSLAFELRKIGYGDPGKFKAALDHLESGGQGLPAHEWSRLSAAARRADREAIAYDRLNEFEKKYLTRAVWFYPWLKGATLFSVRTAVEHPFKTAALGELGQQGRERQEQTLGPTPFYESGLIGLTGGQDPLTTDLSTFSPFSTAADVIHAPTEPGSWAGFFNPVAGAGNQFVNGLNQFGAASKNPYKDALLALAAATPEQQLAVVANSQGQDQSNRIFHKSILGTLERYGAGPAFPRRANKNALASAAARQTSGRR